MAYESVSLKLSVECSSCGNPIPLNGASESVLCDSCQTPFETPPGFWRTMVADEIGEAMVMRMGKGNTKTIISGKYGATVRNRYGRERVCCGNKKGCRSFETTVIMA